MTLTQSDVNNLLDAIRAGGDIDIIRKGAELVLQALIEAEATEVIGLRRSTLAPAPGRFTTNDGAAGDNTHHRAIRALANRLVGILTAVSVTACAMTTTRHGRTAWKRLLDA